MNEQKPEAVMTKAGDDCIDCPKCDGYGYVDDCVAWCSEDHGYTCDVCGGTGEIPSDQEA